MRSVLIAALLAAVCPSVASAQSVTLTDATVVSLYRGTSKISESSGWDACRAEAYRLARADTRTSGTVTYSCKAEIRKVVATYSAAPPPQPPPAPTPTPTPAPPPTPTPAPPPSGDALFADDFEAHPLGCGLDPLLAGRWEDFGPPVASTCADNIAAIELIDGTKALRVTQVPGNQNGTDFRIVKTVGTRADLWVRFAVKFATGYRFATGDHKMLILMDQGQTAQNVYINIRGTAGNPSQGRITVHSIPADTAMSDQNPAHALTVGGWHVIDAWVHAGAQGFVRVRLDGVPLTLVTEAGNQADPERLNVGSIGAIKLDTTYNIGSFITAPMQQYFDTVSVFAHGW